MKILAFEEEVPGVSADAFAPFLNNEARAVLSLYEKGVIREIYFTGTSHEAVIVLECSSTVDARAHLNNLPLVQKGLISFKVEELVPYNGFSRLLG